MFLGALARACGRTRTRPDLIVSGAAYPTAILVWLCARAVGRPFAIYSHGEDLACLRHRAARSRVMGRVLRRASVVMSNSSFTDAEVARFDVPQTRREVLSPAIEVGPYLTVQEHDVETLRRRLGLDGRRVVLTLARLEARKGHDTVVRALPDVIAVHPDVSYLVVGNGSPEELHALADRLGVGQHVVVVEHVTDEELPALFALCDVYAMVSRWDPESQMVEGFGIAYLEAAAVGRPAIAGSAGGAPDAVADGLTGILVAPDAPQQVTSALLSLLGDDALAARMGAAGRERVIERFERGSWVQRVRTVLVNASRRPVEQGPAASR
jgi:phosphatidylinositol alpha-1,6-mannosyltransferase